MSYLEQRAREAKAQILHILDHAQGADLKEVKVLLKELHPEDIADLIDQVSEEHRIELFRYLDREVAAEVIQEVDSDLVVSVLSSLDSDESAEILEELSSDDAADLIADLSADEQQQVLTLMDSEDAQDVQELLAYGEDTAGGIMTTEYVAVRQEITAARAIEVLRESAAEAETIYYIYVVDQRNVLVGVISLRELILAGPDTALVDIMHRKVVTVSVDTDQEEVARIVAKYNLLAIPITDREGQMAGIVTVDDIIDVIHEEATEDIFRLAGATEIDEDENLYRRVMTSISSRLPWLLITLVGGILSGQVIRSFSDVISTVVALAFFIPLLTGMGGNVGTQSSTIIVRGLATGYVDSNKILTTVIKEGIVGLVIGLICGLIVAAVAVIWQGNPYLGFVVGLAMWGNMITAATIGTMVPLIFKRFGIDPAVASAPFISTTIDITGLVIYSTLTGMLIQYIR